MTATRSSFAASWRERCVGGLPAVAVSVAISWYYGGRLESCGRGYLEERGGSDFRLLRMRFSWTMVGYILRGEA